MTAKCLAVIAFFVAGPAMADAEAELRANLDRLRQAAEDSGDIQTMASFALSDYAAAAAYVDACDRNDHGDKLPEMADRYAAWAEPGIMAGISGDRSDTAARSLNSAQLTYSTEKLAALRNGCDRSMLMVQRAGVDALEATFNRYLELPSPD